MGNFKRRSNFRQPLTLRQTMAFTDWFYPLAKIGAILLFLYLVAAHGSNADYMRELKNQCTKGDENACQEMSHMVFSEVINTSNGSDANQFDVGGMLARRLEAAEARQAEA